MAGTGDLEGRNSLREDERRVIYYPNKKKAMTELDYSALMIVSLGILV